jgi:soluble lytic murein transglycosylase-like protein
MPSRAHLPLVRIAALIAVIAGGAIAVPAAATDRVVVVQPGDTMSEIALHYGLTVAQLRDLNGIADPNRIYAGQRLRLTGTPAPVVPTAPTAPAPAAPPQVHVVVWGETMTGIARRYGSSITAIAAANGIANPSYLRAGQKLSMPGILAPPVPAAAMLPDDMAALVAARADIGTIIRAEAEAQGVPVAFALAVAWHESGWRAGAVSHAGAVGVMQITPPTADWVGSTMLGHRVELYDARSNVQAGVTLLKHYLERYHGDRSLVLAAYYQGQTAADRYGVYRMTRPYIASILALESFFSS